MSFGIPVPIGSIERELGRLWKESGESKSRASLINLAIYSEKQDALEANSQIIESIAGQHAMRALLIQADPTAEGNSAEAWINMHCYLRGPSGGEVCSEQIAFLLAGQSARSLQSVVFSHLDSDLPLILWWQADFRPPLDGKIWRGVDRLLFDSSHWTHPREQFELLAGIAETRTILCDLNWARSLPIRQALAGIFDIPGTLAELSAITALQLDHAPGHRTTALLLLGWLVDRLGWQLVLVAEEPQFHDARGALITISFRETGETCINRILLTSKNATFELLREAGSNLYVTTAQGNTGIGKEIPTATRMVRAPREATKEVLLTELARGSRHPLYAKAVKAVDALWE